MVGGFELTATLEQLDTLEANSPETAVGLPALVVMPEDQPATQALGLPVRLVVALPNGWRDDDGRVVARHQVHLYALGVLVLSKHAQVAADRHADLWKTTFGSNVPPLADFSQSEGDQRSQVLTWLVERFASMQQRMAQRTVVHARELSVLRQQHETTQAAFQRLESFVFSHRLTERYLQDTLAPVVGSPMLVMKPGSNLTQRVPGSSSGLSDIALRIANGPRPRSGSLHCILHSAEQGEDLAHWEIPAAYLLEGWLRLALEVALDTDPLGLELRLTWNGDAPLRLETAMAHPDPRFRPILNGIEHTHVPALQIWHFIPGTRAPLSAGGILPLGRNSALRERRLRRVEPAALTAAVNLDTLRSDMQRFHDGDALLVHVLPDRMAAAILGVADSGARQISATICTQHRNGPQIEYAIAVLPIRLRPTTPRAEPDFPDSLHSGWIRIRPMRASQATLIIDDPLDEACDVYLMTRLIPGQKSDAYGWSTFSMLTIRF